MNKSVKIDEIKDNNCNFIVSNIILSKKSSFTYEEIREEVNSLLKCTSGNIESTLEKCLVRLRDDGFLDVLGSTYTPRELIL